MAVLIKYDQSEKTKRKKIHIILWTDRRSQPRFSRNVQDKKKQPTEKGEKVFPLNYIQKIFPNFRRKIVSHVETSNGEQL